MIIKKKNIRSVKSNIPFLKNGDKLVFGIDNIARFSKKISKIGLDTKNIGDTVLPKPIGPRSLFNSEGKYIVHKDLPKETVYYQREWHWKQWVVGGGTEDMSKIVDVPVKRYPREFILPPSIELTLAKNKNGENIIISPLVEYQDRKESEAIHIINLFLEIFGECIVYKENLEELIKTKIIKLNWNILPEGKYPWEKLKDSIKPILKDVKKSKLIVIENRLEKITKYNPEFCAIGKAGFTGYIIMGFKDKKIYVLESIFYGNATYIFENDWKQLSMKTKAEILNKNLQKDRLIHKNGWESKINNIIGNK